MATILEKSIVWDNHACLPLRPDDETFLPQLERLRKTGVTVVGINVGFGEQGIEQHVRMLAHFRRWLLARPHQYLLVRAAADVERAKASGRLGVFFDIEGANAIEDQLSMIELYYDLGVRWMLIAYNLRNRAGGGCMEADEGLTPFGEAVLSEMERVGMIVCCTHTGARTALQVIDRVNGPIIFSHSNPQALWEHPRNIGDDLIRACAAKGGVICVNGVGLFLGANDTRSITVAKNIDYVVNLVGIDHAGIGLDFVYDNAELEAYVAERPEVFGEDADAVQRSGCDFVSPEQIPEIVSCLQAMGYGDDALQRVLGLNMLRVARAVWK
jgi:membrane dipeptidase